MKIIGTIVLAVLSIYSNAQEKIQKEFIGAISVSDIGVLSYKLVFTQNSDNSITGYSITDLNGESLTKTSIVGSFDRTKKELSFNEVSNMFTKTGDDDSTFCFVWTEILKLKEFKGKLSFSGDFIGRAPSGEECAVGKIFMAESDLVKTIISKVDSTKTIEENSSSQGSVKEFSAKQNVVMMSNDKLQINCSENALTLELWDGSIIDGDKIEIYLNGEVLEKEIILEKTKKQIELPLNSNSFKLKVVALNTGIHGVNTVNFALKDAKETKEFTSRLDKGESFEVEFRRKEQNSFGD